MGVGHDSDEPDEVGAAVESFMRATEALLASWSTAMRRLAADPEALSELRRRRELATAEPAVPRRPISLDQSHPLWDREHDG